jgi:cytochrome c-type biogenesis protein CcmH/NrfG
MKAAYSYKSAHQFKDAAAYFDRALQVDPQNVAVRTEMASCLYYDGDVDGALAQLDEALKISPKDANSLFNLGVIRWKGKNDAAGAIHAWQELLQTNPNLDRKPIVERMIAEAKQQGRPQ